MNVCGLGQRPESMVDGVAIERRDGWHWNNRSVSVNSYNVQPTHSRLHPPAASVPDGPTWWSFVGLVRGRNRSSLRCHSQHNMFYHLSVKVVMEYGRLPHMPILRYPLPYCTLPVVFLFVSPPSRRSSSRSFPFVVFPCGGTQCTSVISYPTDCALPTSTFVFWLVQ